MESEVTLPMPRIRWDGTISWGHILTALTFILSMVVGYAWLNKELNEGVAHRQKYTPMIEQNDKLLQLQIDRTNQLSAALSELRSTMLDLAAEQRQTDGQIANRVNDVSIALSRMEGSMAIRREGGTERGTD